MPQDGVGYFIRCRKIVGACTAAEDRGSEPVSEPVAEHTRLETAHHHVITCAVWLLGGSLATSLIARA